MIPAASTIDKPTSFPEFRDFLAPGGSRTSAEFDHLCEVFDRRKRELQTRQDHQVCHISAPLRVLLRRLDLDDRETCYK